MSERTERVGSERRSWVETWKSNSFRRRAGLTVLSMVLVLMIFSGLVAATSSMSMPPAAEAIMTGLRAARSLVMAK